MNYEVEQKFRVADHVKLAARLQDLAITWHDLVTQVDVYYAHPVRDFAATDEALRVRRVGPDNFVTYKGPKLDTETKTRREIELPLAPGDAVAAGFASLLEALGFRRVAEVRKQRRAGSLDWQGAKVEVALDRVEGLGAFAELEVIADADSLESAQERVVSLARRVGLVENERRSYLEMLLAPRVEA